LPVTEAKQRFTELVKGVQEYFDRYVVTKNGKDAAVVMSAEEYESLLETLDVLANRKEVLAILEGSKHAQRGRTVFLRDYLARKERSRKRGGRR